MINNDYKISMQLFLRLRGIESLMTYCSVPRKVQNFYQNVFKPKMPILSRLRRTTRNYKLECKNIYNAAEEFSEEVYDAQVSERRRNIEATLDVLSDELFQLSVLTVSK